MEEKIRELEEVITTLQRKVASLERELGDHGKSSHLYRPHWLEHEARDSYRFLRVPLFSEAVDYLPNGRAYFRTDNLTLNVRANSTTRTVTFT